MILSNRRPQPNQNPLHRIQLQNLPQNPLRHQLKMLRQIQPRHKRRNLPSRQRRSILPRAPETLPPNHLLHRQNRPPRLGNHPPRQRRQRQHPLPLPNLLLRRHHPVPVPLPQRLRAPGGPLHGALRRLHRRRSRRLGAPFIHPHHRPHLGPRPQRPNPNRPLPHPSKSPPRRQQRRHLPFAPFPRHLPPRRLQILRRIHHLVRARR
ncbi:hypothetical protein DM02DRAFT_180517 [Periconia macrospinosa]|uniref:Uncharacterized protein n=1 Tax=Periconia macrospinosa TaxID=97972 RepID=A0A2V1DC60_9PLEO|nr:hypothetical protein DM02DRAFT_180517 [Periconia macrospinosa]